MAQTPISRDYKVTNPQMTSGEVEWIRNRLGGKNDFGIKTFGGDPKGKDYGKTLADAAFEMKWRLGYPSASVDLVYGQTLDRYLIGLAPLPSDYQKRKADRKGQDPPPSKYDPPPISRDYGVTSPQMSAGEVESKIRQRLGRDSENVFGYSPFNGSLKGHNFGTELATATHDMKFRIGYPSDDLTYTYGQTLDAYLIGNRSLPEDYKKRKADRKGKEPPPSKYDESVIEGLRADAVKRALSKVGVKESPPDSNRCFASDWYGMVGPWCAMFCTWAYDPLGCAATQKGSRWAYCPYIFADAKAGRNNVKLVTGDPIKGDWVLFDWNQDGEHDHVGLVTANAKRGGAIPTVEGNTSVSGSQSNGGMVCKKTRYVRSGEITAIVRIVK